MNVFGVFGLIQTIGSYWGDVPVIWSHKWVWVGGYGCE